MNKYFTLRWAVLLLSLTLPSLCWALTDAYLETPIGPATYFTLTGPAGGLIGSASTNFAVTTDGPFEGTITITPAGGGLSTPTVLTFTGQSSMTFSITPTAVGPVTLTPTNANSLMNPPPLTYDTSPGAPAAPTATTGSLPGSVSVAFTVPATGGSPITGYVATCSPGNISGPGGSSPITVSGLTPGAAYTCIALATNMFGNGLPSSPSHPATASATSFTLTGPTGGPINSASTNFTITPDGPYTGTITIGLSGGGLGPSIVKTFSGSATPQTFTITPTFGGPVRLTATNNGMLTNPSSLSYSTPPTAPLIGPVLPGPGSAQVAFLPPEINGGSPVTLYTATCNPGGVTGTGTSSPITVSGLTPGTTYTCTVTATNAVGASLASNASLPVMIPATGFSFTGPAGGAINSASTNFTITPNGPYTGTITITPGGGGLSSPIVLTFTAPAAAQTFTITPTSAGPVTLTPTNSGSLTNPAALSYSTPPTAPTIGTATAGPNSALVAFTTPVSTGGSPIILYTATCGSFVGTGTSSPVTVNGLTPGSSYTCTVTATNSVGISAPSNASNQITIPTVGFSFTGPTGGLINSASGNFTVTPNGPYTGTITITPSGGGLSTPIVLTFSASAAAQTFTITPTAAGPVTLTPTNSGSLANPGALTYSTPPAPPTIGTATAGASSASVAFTPPVSTGGSPITLYTATCNPGGVVGTGTSSPITVSGLTPGSTYTCTVTATNSAGASVASSASNQVTIGASGYTLTGPAGGLINNVSNIFTITPNAPFTGMITITLSGGPATSMARKSSDAVAAKGARREAVVRTFTNSAAPQTFTITPTGVGPVIVTATNNAGLQNPPALSYATPPGPPTIGTATPGSGSLVVAFTPQASGGSAITSYTATCTGGTGMIATGTGTSSPITVGGVTGNTSYTCVVTATNSIGTSAASSTSNQALPLVPATPAPSTFALFSIGAAALFLWNRRRLRDA